mmetsp:Transcript_11234/g.21427  ORF Transcript_11234/g.21427 Transcript_11234/m.21427 type:complete len:372 (+) Transcript_11234:114-1229(+)|eukprot:scaffold3256_cov150-Amphora_coffeaeformis.AAC.1
MKFCKSLQRVVEISDPAYSAFFVNYRMLKKLIKELPSFVTSEIDGGKEASELDETGAAAAAAADSHNPPTLIESGPESTHELPAGKETDPQHERQHHGEHSGAEKVCDGVDHVSAEPVEAARELGKSPGEVAFFKLLHAEFKKATYFFEKAQTEFEIREERVREGMEIMKQPGYSIMVNEKWSLLAKSIFKLYKDLLLLETYAIMAYCAFSKILKKHDKVTGHKTRAPFMTNVVNKANFTHYPNLLGMISRCERLYAEVSERLQQEGKEGLYEDERLFINMISRLNEQVIDSPDGEGAGGPERKEKARCVPQVAVAGTAKQFESADVSKLRSLVEEHDARMKAEQVSEGPDRKRAAGDPASDDNKRPRADS